MRPYSALNTNKLNQQISPQIVQVLQQTSWNHWTSPKEKDPFKYLHKEKEIDYYQGTGLLSISIIALIVRETYMILKRKKYRSFLEDTFFWKAPTCADWGWNFNTSNGTTSRKGMKIHHEKNTRSTKSSRREENNYYIFPKISNKQFFKFFYVQWICIQ